MNEVIANASEMMLKDVQGAEQLHKSNPTLFTKIKDWIDHFVKALRRAYEGVDASEPAAKMLGESYETFKKAQDLWLKALNGAQESNMGAISSNTDSVQYSLRAFDDGTRFVDVEANQEEFTGLSTSEMIKKAHEILREKFQGKVIGIDNRAYVNRKTVDEYTHPSKRIADQVTYQDKLKASSELDNIIDAGRFIGKEEDGRDGHFHNNVTGGFDYYEVMFKVGNEYYSGVINIANIDGRQLLKDITQIRNVSKDVMGQFGKNPHTQFLRNASMDSISESPAKSNKNLLENENVQFSLRSSPVKLTTIEKDALEEYQISSAKMNQHLRNGDDTSNGYQIKALDRAISKAVLLKDTVLYRGVSDESMRALGITKPDFESLRAMIGKTISDKAYLSTTTNSYVMNKYVHSMSGETGCGLIIQSAAGANALSISEGNVRYGNRESEYILPRGAELVVTDVISRNGISYIVAQYGKENTKANDMQYSMRGNSIHYDYSKPFAEQVDDWKNGKIPKDDTLILGGTPKLYQQIGLGALPMTIDQTHIDYAINGTKNADHTMGEEMLKKLPELLQKPVAVIESATRPSDSLVAIVQGEVNGHQMMAAVEVGGIGQQNGEQINVNMISSAYGRKNAITTLLENAIEKENNQSIGVYYINKTEAHDLYARSGVQFPGTALQDGLNHSIFDAGSPVNKNYLPQTETRQFKRWFGKSKVVNDDGTPKVVYHGTINNFNIFNTEAYFTDDYMNADGYAAGENIMEVYLSLKNPLVIDAKGAKWDNLNTEYGNSTQSIAANAHIHEKYDGIIFENINDSWIDDEDGDFSTVYVAFDPTQIKSATDNIGLFDTNNPDIRYSDRSPDAVTDRQLLATVNDTMAQTPLEKEKLAQYKKHIDAFNADVTRLHEVNAEIREHVIPVRRNTGRLTMLKNQQTILQKRIERQNKTLLSFERSTPLKRIPEAERKAATVTTANGGRRSYCRFSKIGARITTR